MTAAFISSLAPMSLTVEGGSSVILATETLGISFGIMQTIHHHSGNIFQTAVVVPGADRRVRVSSPFAGAYALFGLALTPITALAMYLAKFSDFNRLATASHQKISLTAACVAAAQITGWHVTVDGILMADIDIVFNSSDGVVDPITVTDSTSLPAITGSPALHTIGPVNFGAAIVPGVSSSGGSIGSTPQIMRVDGDFFCRSTARLQAQPVMNLTHSDPISLIDAITTLGISIASNVVAYFKAYDATTGVSGSANGISFTVAHGRVHPHGPDEASNVVSATGVEIIGISTDGGTNPLAVATGVTVPTPP